MLPGIKQFDLSGKVAVITGGSKGLGEAMAAGLASAGADLMLVSRNDAEAKAKAAKLAKEYDCKAIGFAADVSRQADTEAMATEAIDALGRVDISSTAPALTPVALSMNSLTSSSPKCSASTSTGYGLPVERSCRT